MGNSDLLVFENSAKSYEEMVRFIDPITADENVAFYGNTLFASSAVSLVIGMVFDAHVRGMKQKDACERKGQGF